MQTSLLTSSNIASLSTGKTRKLFMKSNFPFFLFVGIAAAAFFQSWEAGAADAAQDAVDFRYSPPEWQTLICLPDDPCKSLVDRSGALLYDYDQGGREFGNLLARPSCGLA
jgi:hypothetical protein